MRKIQLSLRPLSVLRRWKVTHKERAERILGHLGFFSHIELPRAEALSYIERHFQQVYDEGAAEERERCAAVVREQLHLELMAADLKPVMVLRSILNPITGTKASERPEPKEES